MASREYQELIKLFTAGFADPADSLETVRAKMAQVHGHPIAADTTVERLDLCGVPAAIVRVADARAEGPILFHIHGGAFVSCNLDDYLFYGEKLSRAVGCPVLEIGYRLAPEHPFPAALDDCVTAYRALLRAKRATAISLIGDSCGGGLAVSTMLRLRDAGDAIPSCAVAICGWFDLAVTGESALEPRGLDPFVDPEWIRRRGRDYLGAQGDPSDPFVSPIHADLSGLPPLLLQAGQIDITRDDAVRLAARAGRDGVDVTLDVWSEMVHGWHGLPVPEAHAALSRAAEFIRAHASSSRAGRL